MVKHIYSTGVIYDHHLRSSKYVYNTGHSRGLLGGMYYKHMTIRDDDSSIISEQSSKLIDNARGVIYDRRMFIIQATDEVHKIKIMKNKA